MVLLLQDAVRTILMRSYNQMLWDSRKPVLTVGFEGETLDALRDRFNVQCVISEDPSATFDWHALHSLQIKHLAPAMSAEQWDCFMAVRAHYLQFNDINSRRHYYVPGREAETWNGFVITFHTVYRLLKEHNIQLVLHANIPHEGFDFVLHQVARHLGVSSVLCYQSLISNRFWLSSTMPEFGRFSSNPRLFNLESSGYSLPKQWFYMKGSNMDAAYGLVQLVREVCRRPHRLPPALVRYVYARQFRAAVAALTQQKVAGERYVYFPLHLQPELTTAAQGGVYADQLLAVEVLSAWVPKGCAIYLKENPKQTEKQRGPHFYQRLRALPNVRLLGRQESSADLIRNSVGVATITGTAGWEALFYGKPVLVFGAAWYREFPGVVEWNSGPTFDEFVCNVPPETANIVAALDFALRTAGKGVVDPAYAELVDGYEPRANAHHVAESLWRYVQGLTDKEAA
jgi:hypothetical protein